MKLNSAVSKFLTNKWVLNIVAVLALFNVIGYAVMGNINTVLYFIVIAVLVRYFSKNMTIVLGVPLIVINLLALKGNMLEGMENNSATNSTNNANVSLSNNISTNKINDQTKINDLVKKNKNKLDSKTGQGLVMQPLDQNEDNSNDSENNNPAQSTGGEQQGFETGRRKNRGYEIDYATTVEEAYDQLNNILGSDGIQRLTSDSQNLMKQQMQLAEAMKGMGPVIKQIAPMVESLKGMMGQMGEGKEGLGGLMDLAKKFSNQPVPAK
jgi:hypothetical protein